VGAAPKNKSSGAREKPREETKRVGAMALKWKKGGWGRARNRAGWRARATEITGGLSDVFELHETLAGAKGNPMVREANPKFGHD
jgi:hypothetical protein